MSLASDPGERADAIEVYLGHQGSGALSLALTSGARPGGEGFGSTLQRATSAVLRGGLTTWVHAGMLVRRLRGRSDPLQGLGQQATFLALCRLVQAALDAVPLPTDAVAPDGAHVRVFATSVPAESALQRIEQVVGPYAAAGTVTRTGRAAIAWFAIRHLIAARSRDYSLQVVHFTLDDGGCQLSLMLPRDPDEDAATPEGDAATPESSAATVTSPASAASASGGEPAARGQGGPSARRGVRPGPVGRRAAGAAAADPQRLQAYLDAYRDHLTRELLLEPLVHSGSAAEFAWAPEPTGDGGVAVGGTVPGAVGDAVVLRMAARAVAQLGERSPQSAGIPLGPPEPDGDLLVRRWAVGPSGGHVLSVAARSGDRRRPTQVLIHVAAADRPGGGDVPDPTPTPVGVRSVSVPPAGREIPRSGPAVDEARGLILLPLWWHSAEARCDGNDVILYEMPFRGRRLRVRVRANDYPAEPMYTLLVGDPGEEVAAVDLEDWPSSWVRPRAF